MAKLEVTKTPDVMKELGAGPSAAEDGLKAQIDALKAQVESLKKAPEAPRVHIRQLGPNEKFVDLDGQRFVERMDHGTGSYIRTRVD